MQEDAQRPEEMAQQATQREVNPLRAFIPAAW